MTGLPQVTVVGTLTADPEVRYTAGGHAVVTFTVAANERRQNRQTGQWEDGATTFLRCQVWRQAAENLAESATRGTRVMVVGELKQRTYEVDGAQRTAFEVEATEVGISTRWATAKVAKATRSGGEQGAAAEDAWTTEPGG